MIWIASFPRSGNTFVRNILHKVYGLESSEYHVVEGHPFDEDYMDYPFVKTHLLPDEVKPADPGIKAVYLVRDGRDSMVSMAHQRKDIVAPGSDFEENLKAAIFAEKDTFFGGWSKNAEAWTERADLIIRYEDLIADPIGQIERLRTIMDLPEPNADALPSFESLKKGDAVYGARKHWGYSEEKAKEFAKKAFRKGKSGSWKTEMPDELHDLFWTYHGNMMERLGYRLDGSLDVPDPDMDHFFSQKLGLKGTNESEKKYHILIEANKLETRDNDGVKRYVSSLIHAYAPLTVNDNGKWKIDLLINKAIIPLGKYLENMERAWSSGKGDEGKSSRGHHKKSLFEKLEAFLQGLLPDRWVKWLTDNNIMIFHKAYDLLKKGILTMLYWIRYMILIIPRYAYTLYLRHKQKLEQKAISERIAHYDLIHVPLQQHYWPFRYSNVPLLFTIHDFTHKLFPSYHTGINIKNAEAGLNMIQKKQAHVVSVSNSTMKDSKKYLDLPEEHFHMVHEAVEEEKFRFMVNREESSKVRDKYGIRKDMPFILILGTIEPRKNVLNSIQAFQELHKRHKDLNLSLVIAGKQGWKMKKFVGYSSMITFTGFVDDDDLSDLYTEALALSYVSFYEGFGLPLLEAMRCGTPVIYGDNSSMPEVVGEGGLGANPENIDDICEKYEELVFDEVLREQLSKTAMKQSHKFSTRKNALGMLGVYENIIEDKLKKT